MVAIPSRQAPWTRRLLELLADGEWHRRDEVVAIAGALIPPGRAMRAREEDVQRQLDVARRRGQLPSAAQRPVRSEEYYISVGRRKLMRDALKLVEQRTDEAGVRWVRYVAPPPGGKHAAFVRTLRDRPGEWVPLPMRKITSKRHSQDTANALKAGRLVGIPAGEYDTAVAENGQIYVCYRGPQ